MKKNWKKNFALICVVFFLLTVLTPIINAISINNESEVIDTSIEVKEDNYDLLVITPKQFERTAKRLVSHKNDVGVNTKLVTLNKLYREMFKHGRDRAEKILSLIHI